MKLIYCDCTRARLVLPFWGLAKLELISFTYYISVRSFESGCSKRGIKSNQAYHLPISDESQKRLNQSCAHFKPPNIFSWEVSVTNRLQSLIYPVRWALFHLHAEPFIGCFLLSVSDITLSSLTPCSYFGDMVKLWLYQLFLIAFALQWFVFLWKLSINDSWWRLMIAT